MRSSNSQPGNRKVLYVVGGSKRRLGRIGQNGSEGIQAKEDTRTIQDAEASNSPNCASSRSILRISPRKSILVQIADRIADIGKGHILHTRNASQLSSPNGIENGIKKESRTVLIEC